MANKNLISTVELIEKANSILIQHLSVLDNAAKSYEDLVNSAKLPSTYVSNLKSLNDTNKKIVDSNKKVIQSQKTLQKERLSELRLQKKRENAFDKFEKQQLRLEAQRKREQIQLSKTTGLYNKVQSGISSLSKQYNDLALRRELNGKLSLEEQVTLGKLEAKLNKYQKALKNVDSRIGRHQRNVGNYKSTFDGLGFSVAQLSRELPAFTNSMQTGFLAISNNIPMLVDEIGKLKKTNVQLAASGKPTVNVLNSVGKAIFSLNGLLGIGITILTVFGPKLIDWAFGMSESEKATKKATEELEKQNKSLKENIKLREKQLKDASQVLNNPSRLRELTVSEAGLIELSERLNKLGIEGSDVIKDDVLLFEDRKSIALNLIEIAKTQNKLELERVKQSDIELKRQQIQLDFKKGLISEDVKQFRLQKLLKEVNSFGFTTSIEFQKTILKLRKENARIIGKTVELEFETSKKEGRSKIEGLELQSKGIKSVRLEFEKMLTVLKSALKLYDSASQEGIFLTKQIEFLEFALKDTNEQLKELEKNNLKELSDWQKQFKLSEDRAKRLRQELEKLQQATNNFINSFKSDVFNNSGLSSLEIFFDGTFDKLIKGADTAEKKFAVTFNAIAESAQEAFGLISQFGQQNFDQMFLNLEQERDLAIQFAGDSSSAREEIDRQYEEKRSKIQRRQAESQRDQALFNIAVDTAQGIVATIGNVGFPAAIPLIAAIGAIGIANATLVSSRQIPEFWEGGEVQKSGNIIVNDDPYKKKGSNYKEIIEKPDGKILKPQGKNVKMNVPKGTIVHPTYGSFLNSLNKELDVNGIMPFTDTAISNQMQTVLVNNSSNGLSKQDLSEVIGRLENTINNKESGSIHLNESGFNKYQTKRNTRRKLLNDSVRIKRRVV